MEIIKKRIETVHRGNSLRTSIAAGFLLLTSCGIIPQSMERFDVNCNGDLVEADFNNQDKAIFVSEAGDQNSMSVIVDKSGGVFTYSVDPYQGIPVRGEVPQDPESGGFAVYLPEVSSDTDLRIQVDQENDTAAIMVAC